MFSLEVDKKEQTLSTTETLSISLDVYFIVVGKVLMKLDCS